MQKIEHELKLIHKERMAPDTVRLDFFAPEAAALGEPGQFFELETSGLLRRPFGLMHRDPQKGLLSFGIKIVGPQSRWLSALETGSCIKAHGPLGHGFPLSGVKHLVAVGGGSGIFPLCEAVKTVTAQGGSADLICGFRSEEDAYPKAYFEQFGCRCFFSSDRGGLDFHGHAGLALEAFLQKHPCPKDSLLIACGPKPLLKFCRDFALRHELQCRVSLEERMACGLGICLGCAVDVKDGQDGVKRVRCCVEGPVFDAEELVWEN